MEWRDIPYWENYIASDEGDIARKDTGEIIKQYPQKSGYVSVYLYRKSNGRRCIIVPVHRLVCMAFHGEEGYIKGLFVDHIDTNRANNRADNLHWVTQRENMNNPNTLNKRKQRVI